MTFLTRRVCGVLLLVLIGVASSARTEEKLLMQTLRSDHPRLLWLDADTKKLQAKTDPLSVRVRERVVAQADHLLDEGPANRVVEGRRMLAVSREVLGRVLTLGTAWRLTGEPRYLDRGVQEMLAAAAFSDWNPSHFLDTAEMTAALGIGYDWFYHGMTPEDRETVREAIIQKGLDPALESDELFVNWTNNWNQVCNGGIVLGALAVAEDVPERAEKIVARALRGLPKSMQVYEPDGVYPEGPGYWSYGTTYNVVLIAALESALGEDFGLADMTGFRRSPDFFQQAIGPTGTAFNFSDGSASISTQPALYWLATELQRPGIASQHDLVLKRDLDRGTGKDPDRFFPLILLWRDPVGPTDDVLPLFWLGQGPNPLAFLRSGWSDDALFVGIKGGKAHENHGHMDNGSFVLERDGVRWVVDPKIRSYHLLESAGVKFWGRDQASDRWKVFEAGPFSHSTLTIDGQLHAVKGFASLTGTPGENPEVAVDLAATLGCEKATRTFRLLPDRMLVVQDKLTGLKPGSTVRWAIPTGAEVKADGSMAVLRQDGKTLRVQLRATGEPILRVEEMTENNPPWQVPRPGERLLMADLVVPENGSLEIKAEFGGK